MSDSKATRLSKLQVAYTNNAVQMGELAKQKIDIDVKLAEFSVAQNGLKAVFEKVNAEADDVQTAPAPGVSNDAAGSAAQS